MAILMTTVATIYLNLTKVNLTFVAWLIVASIGLYYLVLFVNVIYSKNSCHFSKKDITLLRLIFIVGAVLVLALRQSRVAMMIILFIWNAAYAMFAGIKSQNE